MKGNENLELRIAQFLRIGVLLSGFLMALGWLLTICSRIFPGVFSDPIQVLTINPLSAYATYNRMNFVQEISLMFSQNAWGKILIFLGLVLLISLPVMRVMFTGYMLFRQKEWVLGFCALFVFAGLIISGVLGLEF